METDAVGKDFRSCRQQQDIVESKANLYIFRHVFLQKFSRNFNTAQFNKATKGPAGPTNVVGPVYPHR